MNVSEIMSTPVVTVGAKTTLPEIARIMLDRHIGGVPVVREDGRMIGIVTESDFAAKERGVPFCMLVLPQVLGHWLSKENLERVYEEAKTMTAKDIMTDSMITVTENDTVEEAVKRMCESKVHRLPVVRGHVPIGMLTRHDLLTMMLRSAGERSSEM
jgi:CBS domain-containing protein